MESARSWSLVRRLPGKQESRSPRRTQGRSTGTERASTQMRLRAGPLGHGKQTQHLHLQRVQAAPRDDQGVQGPPQGHGAHLLQRARGDLLVVGAYPGQAHTQRLLGDRWSTKRETAAQFRKHPDLPAVKPTAVPAGHLKEPKSRKSPEWLTEDP